MAVTRPMEVISKEDMPIAGSRGGFSPILAEAQKLGEGQVLKKEGQVAKSTKETLKQNGFMAKVIKGDTYIWREEDSQESKEQKKSKKK